MIVAESIQCSMFDKFKQEFEKGIFPLDRLEMTLLEWFGPMLCVAAFLQMGISTAA